jgi:hypothetical protein
MYIINQWKPKKKIEDARIFSSNRQVELFNNSWNCISDREMYKIISKEKTPFKLFTIEHNNYQRERVKKLESFIFQFNELYEIVEIKILKV